MPKKNPLPAIQLTHVTKKYELHHEKPTFSDQLLRRSRHQEIFTALQDINLTIYKGEKVGIIGPNGSGKTTLLKLIAGITTPTSGTVQTFGKVVSLIDLEAGFHPDLSGEENVFLNGLVLGMSRREIRKRYRSIINFADIGHFIDAPLHTYSAGMKLRLGFSVAIHSEPDTLILDEGTSAGDANFLKKMAKKYRDAGMLDKTIISVSHWMPLITDMIEAKRIIWVEKSKIYKDGSTAIVNSYLKKYG